MHQGVSPISLVLLPVTPLEQSKPIDLIVSEVTCVGATIRPLEHT